MRALLIVVGLVLIAAGIWIVSGQATYKQTDTVVQLGPVKATATHDKTIPSWAGIAGIVIGGLLAVGGFARK